MKFLNFFLILIVIVSCKSAKIKKTVENQLQKPFNNQHFTGLFVYDPLKKDTLINHNGNKYFTPASNTKIATLFSGLHLLENRIPAYTYNINSDTIAIQGTGNPTFLHPFFNDSIVINKLKNFSHIKIFTSNLSDKKYGGGWAWEDYDTYFSPERSPFPIYGNVVLISKKDSLKIIPKILSKNVELHSKKQGRKEIENTFFYRNNQTKQVEIPFIIDKNLTQKLWKNLFQKQKITFFNDSTVNFKNIQYSNIHIDSLYKQMMTVSDNFLAEQILIMASSTLSDTLSSSRVRKYILKNQLKELPNKPRWVDGSGLSRYNLFTPSSFVYILDKLHSSIPENRLLNFFPVGGKSGTLKKWFKGNNQPYIFAKSGTLGNNYSLSGYLKTKTGKTLIFSYMNNHYRQKTSDIKKQMELVFQYIRDTY